MFFFIRSILFLISRVELLFTYACFSLEHFLWSNRFNVSFIENNINHLSIPTIPGILFSRPSLTQNFHRSNCRLKLIKKLEPTKNISKPIQIATACKTTTKTMKPNTKLLAQNVFATKRIKVGQRSRSAPPLCPSLPEKAFNSWEQRQQHYQLLFRQSESWPL